ncbi:MAG TPA: signal peptidase I [Trebonia sp.]|nr:signal peptidase I [Trebonia sp.]
MFFGLAVAGVIGALAGIVVTGPDYTVPSTSMQPVLQPGDRIFVARGQDVRRGDIVVFDIPAGTSGIAAGLYVKRLIGLPGDKVACCNAAGEVTVNGKALTESQYLYPGNAPSRTKFSVTLGPGEVWVMGDHRSISLDSRYWRGSVLKQDIVGRVYLVAHGASFTRVATPGTFVADGLALAGGRVTWPLVCAIVAGLALVLLIVLGIVSLILRAVRGRRWRRVNAVSLHRTENQVPPR